MSDVIDAARYGISAYLLKHGESEDASTKGMAIAALRAAEKAGWRLVPVDPTISMECAIKVRGSTRDALKRAIQAAPRPWSEDD